MASEYVRVKDKDTGHEFTIPAARFDSDAMTKLDKPALDPSGDPAPVKHKTSVSRSATAKKATSSGQKAAPKEES